MKKTPWFPASVKPVRKGLYETTCEYAYWGTPDRPSTAYWGGKTWRVAHGGVQCSFGYSCDRWRGLAQDPSKT